MNPIPFWLKNARSKSLPQSLLPAMLAVGMASNSPDFSLYLGILAILGVALGHLSMNLFDDYFDYKIKDSQFRDELASQGIRSRIAKCSYITSGQSSLNQLLTTCFIFGSTALIIGFIIFSQRGEVILYFALATAILGISYSGSPLKLSYHGVGELLIGLMFGPLLVSGVYYSACGTMNRSVLLVSIPIGLLAANIIYIHSIMDYEPDKRIGKMTFAIFLGTKKRMLLCLFIILFASFFTIIAGILKGYLSYYYLTVLLTLPMAVSLFYLMIEFVRNPQRVFKPHFWMGPMGNWDKMKTIGIDWFMIRWLLARNLLSFFCLIIIVINFIL